MSQHLTNQHPDIPHKERLHLAKTAKLAPVAAPARQKGPVRIRGQRSLAEFTRGRTQEVSPYEDLVKAKMGTRNFPAFTVGLGGTHIDDFLEWLQTVEGQCRREREAIQIAVDVSKALR